MHHECTVTAFPQVAIEVRYLSERIELGLPDSVFAVIEMPDAHEQCQCTQHGQQHAFSKTLYNPLYQSNAHVDFSNCHQVLPHA